MTRIRLTTTTKKVLSTFKAANGEPLWGYGISERTSLGTGTVYPILNRLEDLGWIKSYWEDIADIEPGRRQRRHYVLTDVGRDNLPQPRRPKKRRC